MLAHAQAAKQAESYSGKVIAFANPFYEELDGLIQLAEQNLSSEEMTRARQLTSDLVAAIPP